MTRLRAPLLLLTGVAWLAGCASMPHEHPGPTTPALSADEQAAASAYDDLLRADGELHTASAQATPPDCARIIQLRDNICALAARICQIADRQPAGSAAAGQCADGNARCKAATESAQSRDCPKK